MQNVRRRTLVGTTTDIKQIAEVDEDGELSSSDKVVEHINQGILNGRLVPGQRLIESDLTRTLNVSRGPVREAFRRLDALGVITRTLHRGVHIRILARHEATDLLLVVEPLAGLMTYLAAEQIAKLTRVTDRKRIEEALKPYRDRDENSGDLLSQRRYFYETLMIIGGNSQLSSVLPSMRIQLLRLQFHSFFGAEDRRHHLEDYANITDALLAGDAKRSEKLMRQHIKRMRLAVAELPDEAFPYMHNMS